VLCVVAVLASACTSYKRSVYSYEPDYGVDSVQFARALEGQACRLLSGNQVTLLNNGDEIFPAILTDLAAATASINMEQYIFAAGVLSEQVVATLAERAQAGVAVRVLIDDVGDRLGAAKEALRSAGVSVKDYKPVRLYALHRLGDRTHRRIITIDGRFAYIGGFAIDDRWMGDARNPQEWRDLAVRVAGPVVSQIQRVFMEDWVHTTGEVLHGDAQFPALEGAGTVWAQAVASANAEHNSLAKLHYFTPIQAARESIWIENAYFVPELDILEALIRAARRGVDVRIILPGPHIDLPWVRYAGHHHYRKLLEAGVRIFEYQQTMLHTKAMIVDGVWVSIGSMNFVRRSMRSNAEVNLAFFDRDFASEVRTVIESDITSSTPITLDSWRERGTWEHVKETFFALFAPLY
jgi:cardiolipin synthase